MGPIAVYNENPNENMSSWIKWIDDNTNDANKLRTNPSEDDLCLKEKVEEITTHKEDKELTSIIKMKSNLL